MARFTPGSLVVALLRRTWIITAVTVVTCAGFAARAATTLIAPELAATPGDTRRPVAPRPAPRVPRAPDGGQLVARNMFCSGCSLTAPAGVAAADAVLGAVLIATDIGTEARATLRVLASDAQGSWGVGDAIPGIGRVDRIGPMWVEVSDATGRRGRLSLLEAAAGGSSGTAMLASAPAADPLAGVHKLDDQNYEVDRQLVRELVSAGSQPRGPRFVPMFDGGEIKGVRLASVPVGSVPHAIGLRPGDILSAIDGAPVKTLDQLLELYSKLGQLSAVELSGTRAGKPLVRTLHLR